MTGTKKGHAVYIGTIFFELTLILLLLTHVYIRHQAATVNQNRIPIDKNTIQFTPSDTLKAFYEWKPKQTITRTESWLPTPVITTTNSDGFMGNTEYTTLAPPHVFRILTLGDSYTEGAFVSTDMSYPKQLEKLLNTRLTCPGIQKFEVLNFGVGGYDIAYAAQRYLIRGQKYHPDLILWFLKDDDFSELADQTRTNTILSTQMQSDEEKKTLDAQHKNIWDDAYDTAKRTVENELHTKQFIEIQTKALHSVVQTTEKPIVLFTFNFTNREYKARMKSWEMTEPHTQFFDGVRNITALHATFYPNDSHPTANGYTMIAEDVFTYLQQMICTGTQNK